MSIILGKMAIFASKLLGNRGTDIGGTVALKFNKKIFKKLISNIDEVILVTGTNGKTSTTNLIASIINETDDKYLHNKEGANMYTGLLTTLIKNYSFFKSNKVKYGIFEVDEGSVPKVLKDLDKGYLIINNFFRDQLDRYSEIDILIDKIKDSIDETKIKLIINVDDPFCMRFDNEQAIGFGLDKRIDNFKDVSVSDSRFCPVCGKDLVYTKNIFGQLGHYHCSCGFKRKKPKYLVTEIKNNHVKVNNVVYKHNLKGAYNAYNIVAAISIVKEFKIEDKIIKKGLENYFSNDGRMQLFKYEDNKIYLNLVKNPAGMNMSIQEVAHMDIKNICFILNDNDADGKDVSWIWDADFEELNTSSLKKYYASGIRAYDMGLRLKYSGVNEENIIINEDFNQLVKDIIKDDALVISSYTALNETKNIISKQVL